MVSEYNSDAGFDIQSYEGIGSIPDLPDRFIEVKSSSQKNFAIVVTRNELRKAREFREKYHIVFVGNHDCGKQLNECKVVVLTDPIYHVFNPDKYTFDAPKLRIVAKDP